MVDFNKLRQDKKRSIILNPYDIFRHLPKPIGINDLYASQVEVLSGWFSERTKKDHVIKLHTGGGKTLVGLLIAQSSMNELQEPAIYLTPTKQLVNQTLEKAKEIGIDAVPYRTKEPLPDAFLNSKAILVATYQALFNGHSKFGIRGNSTPTNSSCVILDDAHTAFSTIRDSFSLEIEKNETYKLLSDIFRQSFIEIDRIGTFDDIVSGNEYGVLEIPYFAWQDHIDTVREILRKDFERSIQWPLIRDNFKYCHGLISKNSISITPIFPFVNMFPTFSDSPRRIYMSATISDDSEIIKTFDATFDSVESALSSKSLAGVSERMILIPQLMRNDFNQNDLSTVLMKITQKGMGALILVPSDEKAKAFSDVAKVVKGSADVDEAVKELQNKENLGPFVFANRYDGIDLPGDSCRLLVLHGLPTGTSNYELFKATILWGATSITRMITQRLEQGIGRGARGAGDHCAILLLGSDVASWISKESNFSILTSSTKAQIEIGILISKEINSINDFIRTVEMCLERDSEWIKYHAEALADMTEESIDNSIHYKQASIERKSQRLWLDGYYEKAISKIESLIASDGDKIDSQNKGWLLQEAARIAYSWGNKDRSEELQRAAFSFNRNLHRPQVLPPYRPIEIPTDQAKRIVEKISEFKQRKGFMHNFEGIVSKLHSTASANMFENSLCELGKMIGFAAERHDQNGDGPDVLWILPNNSAFIIEAKSRKYDENPLTKEQHGQLLVAEEWFKKYYNGVIIYRVSVHPTNKSTKVANAEATHVLTFEKLSLLISDTRNFFNKLCESQLDKESLNIECQRLLDTVNFTVNKIANSYLQRFEAESDS